MKLPGVSAAAGILVDVQTGTVLWERGSSKEMFPASLTKVMTAILVLERGNLDRSVRISQRAANTGESGIGLEAGEKLTVRQLLEACLIKSANDAAVALAETTAGSVEAFVEAMNRKAVQLGAASTHFVNPHGLHDEKHVSTAADLAKIARHALSAPSFRQVVRTRRKTIPWPGKEWDRTLHSTNRLLSRWELCDGVKTGYTKQAGNCLIATATKEGWQLLCVLLNSEHGRVWQDARTALEAGFAKYQRVPVRKRGAVVDRKAPVVRGAHPCPLKTAEAVICVVPAGKSVTSRTTLRPLRAPVAAGMAAGSTVFWCSGKVIGSTSLVAAEPVPLALWWRARPLLFRALAMALVLIGARLLYGTLAETHRRRWTRKSARRRGVDHRGARSGEWRDRNSAGDEGGPDQGHPRG